MTPFKNTQELQIFLEKIISKFTHEKNAILDLILALLTNNTSKATTVVELTLNKYFKREFSSLFKAICGYYAPRKEQKQSEENRKQVKESITDFLYDKALCSNKSRYSFCLDMTGKLLNNSPKTPDRSYIYSNGNIGVGHVYSAICLNVQEGWMLPMSILRIPTTENKFDFAISQMISLLKKIPDPTLAICVGDCAYSCNKFVHSINQYKNAVSLTRVRSNKTIFIKYKDTKEGVGRKRQYGKKYCLTKDTLPEPDCSETFEETTSKGKVHTIKISLFKNYIVRGSKGYKMSDVLANFLRVQVYNKDGSRKYPKDLWVQIVGKRKDELTPKQAYMEYKDRFNIEFFFKFGKSKLLMDKFQTTDPNRAEDFIMFGMISYNTLYYLKDLLDPAFLRKWENKKDKNKKSPSRIFRALSNSDILDNIDQAVLKKRGIPNEKNIRKFFHSSENQPIIHKDSSKSAIEIEIKSRFGNNPQTSKTSVNVDPNSNNLPLELIVKKTEELCNKIWPQGG